MSFSFSTLVARLSDRVEEPLPGHEAHLTMAPRYPARREDLSVGGRDCRMAGVLVPLLLQNDSPVVVLTVRRDHLPDHAGQISFPGGQRENDESVWATALREAEEEVALDAASVQALGRLTPLYISPSNFCVHPGIGAVDDAAGLRPTDREVERVLHVPLADFLDPNTRETELRSLQGRDVEVPYYAVAGHKVWGATAMILAEFLAVVRDVMPSSA